MFTVHELKVNGSLANKECLNNNELDQWMIAAYGKFATIQVVQDLTGKSIVYTDNGEWWEKVS